MSDNKKYYYLKIKDNFFDTDEIKILESMENGYIYSNILLKMNLKSAKYNGRLMFNDRIPYNPKMISTITGQNIDHVEKAIKVFIEMGMIEVLDNGAIYMLDIQNFVGQSSTEADRIRAYRGKIESEKQLTNGDKPQDVVQMYDKRTPELELELELKLKKEPQSVKPDYIFLFNSFWENYPKKIGKKECKAKYIDMIKKNDIYLHVMIIDALQDQINWRKRAESESAFVPAWKDPIRWLRHECWNDELGEIEHKNKDFKKRTEFNNTALFPQSYKNGKVCVICDNSQLVNGVKCPCVNYDYVPLEHWDEWMKYYKEVKPISYNEYIKGK